MFVFFSGMYNHLMGKPHKEMLFKRLNPDKEIPRDVERVLAKDDRVNQDGKIRTIYSDELYPWDSGKAPWSIERGGTGRVPDNARKTITDEYGQSVDSKLGVLESLASTSSMGGPSSLAGILSMNLKLESVEDRKVAAKVCQKLADVLMESDTQSSVEPLFGTIKMAASTYLACQGEPAGGSGSGSGGDNGNPNLMSLGRGRGNRDHDSQDRGFGRRHDRDSRERDYDRVRIKEERRDDYDYDRRRSHNRR